MPKRPPPPLAATAEWQRGAHGEVESGLAAAAGPGACAGRRQAPLHGGAPAGRGRSVLRARSRRARRPARAGPHRSSTRPGRRGQLLSTPWCRSTSSSPGVSRSVRTARAWARAAGSATWSSRSRPPPGLVDAATRWSSRRCTTCRSERAGEIPTTAHDIHVDLVVTPTRVVRCPRSKDHRLPRLDWSELTDEKIAAIPLLTALAAHDPLVGSDADVRFALALGARARTSTAGAPERGRAAAPQRRRARRPRRDQVRRPKRGPTREYFEESCRFANLFAERLPADGPRHVAVLLDNTPDYLFAFGGAALHRRRRSSGSTTPGAVSTSCATSSTRTARW